MRKRFNRRVEQELSYCASPYSPCYEYPEQPQKEPITCYTVASMSLVCPHMCWLHIEVERGCWPVDSVAVNIVFLIEQKSNHGTDEAKVGDRERRQNEVGREQWPE
jgi:hypothetical protein